ncbi:substrate-binding domain-containing protein [Orrella dioscoreae]|uniref:substrate-binding domain-containing protein n=1 Tax=Orrella dioscoreae TaxID=1851544 RepID=UPI00093C6141|nr:substrate-binding domain-containing protein [Orrella dioscoreae]
MLVLIFGKRCVLALCIASMFLVFQANAQPLVGGGSTASQGFFEEFFSETDIDAEYVGIGSGKGKQAYLENDSDNLTIGGFPVYVPKVLVAYSSSESKLTISQLDEYNHRYNNGFASLVADFGPVVQVPYMVATVTFPYRNSGISDLNLTDAQICAIFSGNITNWSQLVSGASGTIDLVYRIDESGTTEIMARFLSSQCAQNFQVSNNFAQVMSNVGGIRANWIGVHGGRNMALVTKQAQGRLGYVAASHVDVNDNAQVARVRGVLPSLLSTTLMQAHVTSSPPSPPQWEHPLAWSPEFSFPPVPGAYPVMGYGNLTIGQCYEDESTAEAVAALLAGILASDQLLREHQALPLFAAWKNAINMAFLTPTSELAIGNAVTCSNKGRKSP